MARYLRRCSWPYPSPAKFFFILERLRVLLFGDGAYVPRGYCDDQGSCGMSDCSNIDASNNAVCAA